MYEEQQQQRTSNQQEDESFINDSTKYVKLTSKTKALISSIIVYQQDSLTIQQIIEQYIHEEDVQLQIHQVIVLTIHQNVILPFTYSLRKIKSMIKQQHQQCLSIQIIKLNQEQLALQIQDLEKLFQLYLQNYINKHVKIELCFQFVKIKQNYYEVCACDLMLEDVVKGILEKNKQQFAYLVKDITKHPFQLFFQENQLDLKSSIIGNFVHKSIILIKFTTINFEERSKVQKDKRKIKFIFHFSQDPVILIYQNLKELKVQTILQNLGLDRFQTYGVKILQCILKPYDFLKQIEKDKSFKNSEELECKLLKESNLFYEALPEIRKIKKFEVKQLSLKEYQVEECRKLVDERIESTSNKCYKSEQFVNPIVYYTSPHCYQPLNEFLRMNNFSQQQVVDYNKWQYRFASALVESLQKLPNQARMVYRGVNIHDTYTVGEMICLKGFSSTSLDLNKATNFGRKTIYHIQSLTGKDISKFSYYQKESQILMLPYTYYQITEVNRKQRLHVVKMVEIPTPKNILSNILLWVDDNTFEAQALFREIKGIYPKVKTELIQLLSNELLESWLKEFYVKDPLIKMTLITDMRRGEEVDAGVKTITIAKKYLSNICIFVYVGNIEKTLEIMNKNMIEISKSIEVGNKKDQVSKFIIEKCLTVTDRQQSCQLI